MSDVDLIEAVRGLRDEVLDTAHHGDREPPGTEVFEALLRALSIGGDSVPGLDLALHDAVARRLAWGDSEESVLADAERVFDRILAAIDPTGEGPRPVGGAVGVPTPPRSTSSIGRVLRDPDDQMVVIEAATQAAVTVARVVALAAVARAGRDRATRMREEMSQRQLREVLDKQKATIKRLEQELRSDFG